MTKTKTNWKLIPQTPNYEFQGYKAVYKYTHSSGFASYKVIDPRGNIVCVGGLPAFI